MDNFITFITSGIIFITGNYFYQMIQPKPNFKVATERSYFQFILLLFLTLQVTFLYE